MISSSDNFLVRRIDRALVFTLTRPDLIDPDCIHRIGEEISACVRSEERPRAIVDFENVRFISSTALGMLVVLHKVLLERGGALAICNVADEIRGVFRMTRLHDLMSIHPNVEDAVKSSSETR